MYNNVEDHGSAVRAIGQAIIFAVYICALAILAILAVPFVYFVLIAVVGLPATGLLSHLKQENQAKRWIELEKHKSVESTPVPNHNSSTAPVQVQSATDSAGNPVIYL